MRVPLSSNTLRYFPAALLLLSSCSVLYDLSPDQCERKSDCAKFGSAYSCEAGICKGPPGSEGGSTSTGGTGGDSGTTGESGKVNRGGTAGGTGALGGKGNGGGGIETSNGGSVAGGDTGGTGGQVEPPECVTHYDCFAAHSDPSDPYACIQNHCVPLTTDDCRLVLPLEDPSAFLESDAIIIGGYAYVPPSSNVGVMVSNYDLVLKSFNSETGVFAGTGKPRRKIVMVVCKTNIGSEASIIDIEAAAAHLIDDLKVPAILAALAARDVQAIFEEKAQANNVFIMAPNYADETLISLADDNLIWHMLSGASYVGLAYKPLLDLTLTHLRNLPAPALGPTENARVQLVTVKQNDERFLEDLGTTIRDTIQFNGMSALANASLPDPAFNSVATTSWYALDNAPQTEVINSVLDFGPHVVIAANSHEIYGTIKEIESQWPTRVPGRARPFYLLSPFVYNQLTFIGDGLDTIPGLRQRILGVNWPAAEDSTNYDNYQALFNLTYDLDGQSVGYENFYDAAFYLVYATGAAWNGLLPGSVDRGTAIAEGMERIRDTRSVNTFNVGDDIQRALTLLEAPANNKIRLVGAMGPPNWDGSGARLDAGSIWCIANTSGTNREVADVLRYNDMTGRLEGTVPCFTFPAPAP